MATLNSINSANSLSIDLKSISAENWIFSRISFSHLEKEQMTMLGSYFDEVEIRDFLLKIQNLLLQKTDSVESVFLEPNLEIEILSENSDTFTINVLCRTYIDYKEGNIVDSDRSTKKMQFTTDMNTLNSFVNELKADLQTLSLAKIDNS